MSNPSTGYVMGHDDREKRRLALQGSVINPFSEQLLRRAGISAGMRVLDMGRGIGDLSMVAARLVGRHGRVRGVDVNESALATAAGRCREQGLRNAAFVRADVQTYHVEGRLDAVIGRHILIHTPDP